MGARDNGVRSEDGIRKRSEEIERELNCCSPSKLELINQKCLMKLLNVLF